MQWAQHPTTVTFVVDVIVGPAFFAYRSDHRQGSIHYQWRPCSCMAMDLAKMANDENQDAVFRQIKFKPIAQPLSC